MINIDLGTSSSRKYTQKTSSISSCEKYSPSQYKCGSCGKAFHNNSDLKRHLNRKTPCNNRSYTCEYCHWRFSSKSNLYRHIEKVPTVALNISKY